MRKEPGLRPLCPEKLCDPKQMTPLLWALFSQLWSKLEPPQPEAISHMCFRAGEGKSEKSWLGTGGVSGRPSVASGRTGEQRPLRATCDCREAKQARVARFGFFMGSLPFFLFSFFSFLFFFFLNVGLHL